MAGLTTVSIPSAADGGVDLSAFRAALGSRTAAIMITNPSTLGLFESRIGDLLAMVHEAGALAYMDGANLNAIMGRYRPGAVGFDVMHINTHKTFSTPHGGGGPGAGPVGVGERLLPYLPAPRVLREADGTFRLERPDERTTSIGRLRSFVGSTGVLVRAYAYIRTHGGPGLEEVTDDAVLAATTSSIGWPHPVPTTSRSRASASTSSSPRPRRSSARPGSGRSTSPSASSTTVSMPRRSTSRSRSTRGC
jgi:glycine dehydrogenase subunit 2